MGSLQFTGGRKVYFNRLCSNLWWAGDVVVMYKHDVAFAFVPRQCVGEKPVLYICISMTNFEGG